MLRMASTQWQLRNDRSYVYHESTLFQKEWRLQDEALTTIISLEARQSWQVLSTQ